MKPCFPLFRECKSTTVLPGTHRLSQPESVEILCNFFDAFSESAKPSSAHHHHKSTTDELTLGFVAYLLSRLLLLHAHGAWRLFPTFMSMYTHRIPTFGGYASSLI